RVRPHRSRAGTCSGVAQCRRLAAAERRRRECPDPTSRDRRRRAPSGPCRPRVPGPACRRWRSASAFIRYLRDIGAELYQEDWLGGPPALTCIAPEEKLTNYVVAALRSYRDELQSLATPEEPPTEKPGQAWVRV